MKSQVSSHASSPLESVVASKPRASDGGGGSKSIFSEKELSLQCLRNPPLNVGMEKRPCRSSSDAASTTSGEGAREDDIASSPERVESSSDAILQYYCVGEMVEQLQQCEAAAEVARAVTEQLLAHSILKSSFSLQSQLSQWKLHLDCMQSARIQGGRCIEDALKGVANASPACSLDISSQPSTAHLTTLARLLAEAPLLSRNASPPMNPAELEAEISRLEKQTKELEDVECKTSDLPSSEQVKHLFSLLSEEEVLLLLRQCGLSSQSASTPALSSESSKSTSLSSASSSTPCQSLLPPEPFSEATGRIGCRQFGQGLYGSGFMQRVQNGEECAPSTVADFESVAAFLRREDSASVWRERLRLARPSRALRRVESFKHEAEDVFRGQQNMTVMSILASVDNAIRGARGVIMQPEELDRRILELVARVLPLKGEDARAVESMLDMEAVLQARDDFVARPRRAPFLDLIALAKMCKHIPGVCFDKWNLGWIATWRVKRRPVHKHFSAKKYGFFRARQFAICYRSRMTDSAAGQGVLPTEVIIDGEVFKAPPGFEEEGAETGPAVSTDLSKGALSPILGEAQSGVLSSSLPQSIDEASELPVDLELQLTSVAASSASPGKRLRPPVVAFGSSGLLPFGQHCAWNSVASVAPSADAPPSRDVWADLVSQMPRVERVSFDFTNQSWVAQWKQHGRTTYRRFAVSKYGFFKAHQLAVEFKNKFFKDGPPLSATFPNASEAASTEERRQSLVQEGREVESVETKSDEAAVSAPIDEEDTRPYKTRRLHARRGEFVSKRKLQQLRRSERAAAIQQESRSDDNNVSGSATPGPVSVDSSSRDCTLSKENQGEEKATVIAEDTTEASCPASSSSPSAGGLDSFALCETGVSLASSNSTQTWHSNEADAEVQSSDGASLNLQCLTSAASLEKAILAIGDGSLLHMKRLLLPVVEHVAASLDNESRSEEKRRLGTLLTAIQEAPHAAALLPFFRVFKEGITSTASQREANESLLSKLLALS